MHLTCFNLITAYLYINRYKFSVSTRLFESRGVGRGLGEGGGHCVLQAKGELTEFGKLLHKCFLGQYACVG